MKNKKQGFRVDPGCPTAVMSMLAFGLCIPLQIMGYADSLNDPLVAVGVVFPTVLSAFLMIAAILRFGRDALWFSIIAVTVGVLGFTFKLMLDPRGTSQMHHISAAVLYLGIVVLWALTVLYVIKTKWVLTTLFLIPFFKHIFLDDVPVLIGKAAPLSVSMWLKEFCMLSFMLALSLCAVSFEKTDNLTKDIKE